MKKVLSVILIIIMMITIIPIGSVSVVALTSSEVKNKLDILRQSYPAGSYNPTKECYDFIALLTQNIFGHGLPTQSDDKCSFKNNYTTNFNQIGKTLRINDGTLTESSLKNLFSQAQSGDVVQMNYTTYKGEHSYHVMMVYSASSNGVILYHAGRYKMRKGIYSYGKIYFGVGTGSDKLNGSSGKEMSYSEFKKLLCKSGDGISIYRSKKLTGTSTGSTTTTPTTPTSTSNPDSYPFPSKTVNNANYKAGVVTANEIKWVQAVLYQFGFLTSSGIDGKFGPNSVAATKKFQSAYGLAADGSAGPNTLSKMKSLWNTKKGTHTHTVVSATCTKPMHCSTCGVTAGKALGHIYSNSCDSSCNRCSAKRTIKHTYTNNCDTTCNYCNAKRTINHTYSNSCDTTCNVCKATRAITHTYKTLTTTKATLSKNGKIVKACTVCDKLVSTTIKYAKTFTLSTTSYTYDGSAKKPSVTVKDSSGKAIPSKYYTVIYSSGRKNVGTYKVTVMMKGNYIGSKTLYFKIKPADISKGKLSLSTTSYTYNGSAKTPSVTVKNSSGIKLAKNTHYTVTYSSGRKNVGTYKVTVKGKGNYTGTKTLTFKIVPKAASVNTLTAGSKKLTVKLNRSLKQSTGYQIQYSTSKTFKNAKTKTITSYKTSSTTLTGLKAKNTYYVRVRTYKTIGKTKYYSNWSSYKYKKTK